MVSPIHRDPTGQKVAGTSWESLTDRLIREAQERGEWDTTGWNGRRLPAQDGVYEDELAAGHAILRNAGVAPPWIETDKEARRLLAERDRLLAAAGRTPAGGPGAARIRRSFEENLDRLEAVVRRLEIDAPTSAQQRRLPDRDAERAALEQAIGRAR